MQFKVLFFLPVIGNLETIDHSKFPISMFNDHYIRAVCIGYILLTENTPENVFLIGSG